MDGCHGRRQGQLLCLLEAHDRNTMVLLPPEQRTWAQALVMETYNLTVGHHSKAQLVGAGISEEGIL